MDQQARKWVVITLLVGGLPAFTIAYLLWRHARESRTKLLEEKYVLAISKEAPGYDYLFLSFVNEDPNTKTMGSDIVFTNYLKYKNYAAFMERVTPPPSLRAFHHDCVTQTRIIANALKRVFDQKAVSEPFIDREKFATEINQCRDALQAIQTLQHGIKPVFDRVLDALKKENSKLEAKEKEKYDFSR